MTGQLLSVQNSVMVPYNMLIWLKKSTAAKERKGEPGVSTTFLLQHPRPTKVWAKPTPSLKHHLTSRHFSHPGIWMDSPVFKPELHLAFHGIRRFSFQAPEKPDGFGDTREIFLRLSTPGLNLYIPCLKLLFFPSNKQRSRPGGAAAQTQLDLKTENKKRNSTILEFGGK